MKITYIHHSSFLAELDSISLLFDYFEGELPSFDNSKPLVVLASHRHGDHFSPAVFELAAAHPDIYFILSDDIWKKRVPEEFLDRTVFLAPRRELNLQELFPSVQVKIETFLSTDEGVAFLVCCDGKTIYHAGDLNHWRWKGEPDHWNEKMEKHYRDEIKRLVGKKLDIAFLPLDPRQEEWFYLGMDDFLRLVDVDIVFPMHFWNDFTITDKMKSLPCSDRYREKIIKISSKGEVFSIDK